MYEFGATVASSADDHIHRGGARSLLVPRTSGSWIGCLRHLSSSNKLTDVCGHSLRSSSQVGFELAPVRSCLEIRDHRQPRNGPHVHQMRETDGGINQPPILMECHDLLRWDYEPDQRSTPLSNVTLSSMVICPPLWPRCASDLVGDLADQEHCIPDETASEPSLPSFSILMASIGSRVATAPTDGELTDRYSHL